MSVQYKDITTVEQVASLSNDACVYVNSGGALKQAPLSLFGATVQKCKTGLTVAIIGDSISTHPQKNVSEITVTSADVGVELSSYISYYDIDKTISLDGVSSGYTITSDDVGTELTFIPCSDDVGKKLGTPKNYNSITSVWWQVAADELGFTPVAATWSGSSITAHTASSSEKAASYAWHDHTIRTLGRRVPGSMERIAPDVVLIYRGTNDLSHSTKVRLTEGYFDTVDWTYPETDLLSDGATYGYKEGLALTIQKIRETYPKAQIMLCTCNVFKRSNYSHFPTHNGYFSIPQMNNAIREVADFFGIHTIELDKCGITFENCYDEGYITDSATTPTHPNATGHAMMARQAICDMVNKLHIYDIDPIYVEESGGTAAYLVESLAVYPEGTTSANSAYFALVDYPVTAGDSYSIPYGRNYYFTDSSGAVLSGGGAGGAAEVILTAPADAAYITICFKYVDIATTDAKITNVSDSGSGTGELLSYIVDPWACWDDGTEQALSGYYAVVDYPVEASTTYSIPYGRNYFFEDSSHTHISGGAGGGSSTLQITTPANAAYLTICFKPTDLAKSDVAITPVTGGSTDSGGEETVTKTQIGDLSGVLMEGYLIASTSTGTISGGTSTTYYVYAEIEVDESTTYNTPYARNTAFYQADGTYISGATAKGSATGTLTTPAGAAKMAITYKYEDVDPANVTITKA